MKIFRSFKSENVHTFSVLIVPRDGISARAAACFMPGGGLKANAPSSDREYTIYAVNGSTGDHEFLDLEGGLLSGIKGGFPTLDDAKAFIEKDAAQRHALHAMPVRGRSC